MPPQITKSPKDFKSSDSLFLGLHPKLVSCGLIVAAFRQMDCVGQFDLNVLVEKSPEQIQCLEIDGEHLASMTASTDIEESHHVCAQANPFTLEQSKGMFTCIT